MLGLGPRRGSVSGSGLRSGSGPGPEARFCAQCCGPVLVRVLVSGPILALVLGPRRCPNPLPPDAVVPVWGTAQCLLPSSSSASGHGLNSSSSPPPKLRSSGSGSGPGSGPGSKAQALPHVPPLFGSSGSGTEPGSGAGAFMAQCLVLRPGSGPSSEPGPVLRPNSGPGPEARF